MLTPQVPAGVFIQATSPQSQIIYPNPCTLMGWALAEFSGVLDSETDLYSGPIGGSQAFANVNLHAAESDRQWFGPGGISLPQGLGIFQLVGTIVGGYFIIPGVY